MHRDVKPGNVLIDAGGRAILADFGIARTQDSTALTTSGVLVGSPSYIAPERARGERGGPESDLWSLGATLYALVEGRPAYDRAGPLPTLMAVVNEDPDPPSRAGVLWPVIRGLLDHVPSRRLGPDEAERMLRQVAESGGGSGTAICPHWRRRRRRAAGAGRTRPGSSLESAEHTRTLRAWDAGPARRARAPSRRPPGQEPAALPEEPDAAALPERPARRPAGGAGPPRPAREPDPAALPGEPDPEGPPGGARPPRPARTSPTPDACPDEPDPERCRRAGPAAPRTSRTPTPSRTSRTRAPSRTSRTPAPSRTSPVLGVPESARWSANPSPACRGPNGEPPASGGVAALHGVAGQPARPATRTRPQGGTGVRPGRTPPRLRAPAADLDAGRSRGAGPGGGRGRRHDHDQPSHVFGQRERPPPLGVPHRGPPSATSAGPTTAPPSSPAPTRPDVRIGRSRPGHHPGWLPRVPQLDRLLDRGA